MISDISNYVNGNFNHCFKNAFVIDKKCVQGGYDFKQLVFHLSPASPGVKTWLDKFESLEI